MVVVPSLGSLGLVGYVIVHQGQCAPGPPEFLRTGDAPSHLMNGAMRSHNAADQSHLRRPSARCRRQSRGPQRSIPNRPLRR